MESSARDARADEGSGSLPIAIVAECGRTERDSSLRDTNQNPSEFTSMEGGGSETRRHSDEAVLALQSMKVLARGLKPKEQLQLHQLNLHHLAVLRKHFFSHKPRGRGSTGSLSKLDVPASLKSSVASGTGADEAKHEKRYEEMMLRFQVRRLQSPDDKNEGPFTSQRKLRRGSGSAIFSVGQRGSFRAPSLGARALSSRPASRRSLTRSASKYGRQRGSLLDTRATVLDMSNTAAANAQAATNSLAAGDDETAATVRAKLQRIYADGASWRWVLIAWKRKLANKWRRLLRGVKQPMSPFSTLFRVRMAVLGAGLSAYVVSFPLNLAFDEVVQDWTRWVDYALEVISCTDFLLMFNTSFLDAHNELVTSRRAIAIHYITGWGVPDFVSSVPLHFALDFFGGTRLKWSGPGVILTDAVPRIVRIVHFLVIMQFIWDARPNHTGKSLWDWLLYSRYSHLLRIGFIIGCILVTAHYMACIWKTLYAGEPDFRSGTVYEVYASSFYDALQLLQGQGVPTSSLQQNAFASFAVLVGSIVLAIIFGHVAVLVSNFNANSTNYQRKMEGVFAIMTKMQLPAPLRERIHQYYEHLWREYESLDGEIGRFSKDLSHTLELEVVLFKYMELVMGVPFWKECSPDFQKQLALSLHIRVYLPDDFIIRRGEIGDEFYMINHGSCEFETGADTTERATVPLRKKNTSGLSDFADFMGSRLHPTSNANDKDNEDPDSSESSSDGDYSEKAPRKSRAKRSIYRTENFDPDENPRQGAQSSKSIKKLTRGQAFGEIALLMNYQRTVNVRAITYVEMCVLSRSDFHQILARHTDDRKLVTMSMLVNFIERNESNKVECPLLEVVREVYGEGDPVKTAAITPTFAAELIARILIPELEDASIRYGITGKLMEQLAEYRDRIMKKDSVSPALLARIESIESTQEQIMRCINEMRGFISEMQNARLASTTKEATQA